MKSSLRLSLVILFSTLCLNGQAHKSGGLHLTGSIVGLNVVAECSGSEGRLLVQAELSMQFRNGSDRRLIVFKPHNVRPYIFGGEVGTTRINFLRNLPSTTDKESERIQVKDIRTDNCRPSRYYGNYDPIASFIKRIDLPVPGADLFVMIEPRSYHEFREVVTLDTGYEIDVKLGKSLKEARARSEYPAFELQYHLSLKGNEKGEGFLKSLQSRWKALGDLVLDGSGDFTVTSEPIINRGVE